MGNSSQLELIEKYNSKDLYEKLLSCTIFYCRAFLGSKWNNLSKGLTYKDIIQEAFRRACKRNWENLTEEIFRNYMFGAIKSIVSGLSKSPATKRVLQLNLTETENELGEAKYKTAESSLAVENEIEEAIDRKILIELIESQIKGDKDLQEVLSGILVGMKDQEISTLLELPINIVRNTKKRLLRIVEKISKSL